MESRQLRVQHDTARKGAAAAAATTAAAVRAPPAVRPLPATPTARDRRRITAAAALAAVVVLVIEAAVASPLPTPAAVAAAGRLLFVAPRRQESEALVGVVDAVEDARAQTDKALADASQQAEHRVDQQLRMLAAPVVAGRTRALVCLSEKGARQEMCNVQGFCFERPNCQDYYSQEDEHEEELRQGVVKG